MRHILHLFAFDLKALRIWLLAFAGVIVAQVGLYAFVPYRPTGSLDSILWGSGFIALRLGLTAFITAALVQRDALVGTTAFWRTRAIPRRPLLASKLATLVVALIVPPAFITAAVVFSAGLYPADALAAAGEIALQQAAMILAALPLAVVTATLAHFLIGVGDLVAVAGLGVVVAAGLRQLWPDAKIDAAGWQPSITFTILVCGAIAVVVFQYLSLRTKRSLIVLGVTLVIAATSNWVLYRSSSQRAVTWDSARTVMNPDGRLALSTSRLSDAGPPGRDVTVPPASAAGVMSESVALSFDPSSLETGQGWEGPPNTRVPVTSVFGRLNVAGTPDVLVLSPVEIESELKYEGGDTVKWGPRKLGSREPREPRRPTLDDQPYRAIKAAIGGVGFEIPAGWQGNREWSIDVVAVPKDIWTKHEKSDAALSAHLTLTASRYVVSASVPLRAGSSFTLPSRHVSIVSVNREERGPIVTVRDSTIGYRTGHLGVAVNCLLRNPARRQAVVLRYRFDVLGKNTTLNIFSAGGAGAVAMLATETYVLRTFPEAGPVTEFQPDEEWLKGAELVVISKEDLGRVTLPLRAENLRLPPLGGGGA